MPLTRLDPIDRLILAELQADGRMTNVELANVSGFLHCPACVVCALEEQGFINGYHAQVDARALGFEVQVSAMVGLQSQAESWTYAHLRTAAANGRWYGNAIC